MPVKLGTATLLLSSLLAVGAVEAKALKYECRFPHTNGPGADEVRAVIDPATGSASVTDESSLKIGRGPKSGRLFDGPARRMIAWSYEMSNLSGQRARVDWTLIIYKDGRPAILRWKPYGYVNDWRYKGTCKQSQG